MVRRNLALFAILVATLTAFAPAASAEKPLCSTEEMSQLMEVLESLTSSDTIELTLRNVTCDWEQPFAGKAKNNVGSGDLFDATIGMAGAAQTPEGCVAASKTAGGSEPQNIASSDYVGAVGSALRNCFQRTKGTTPNVLVCSRISSIWREYCALGITSD